jgi:hypothetical protein
LQQATSALDSGKMSILAKAQVPDVVPSRMKYGDIPSDVPRAMIRTCCGRYDTRIPRRIKLSNVQYNDLKP